MATMDLASLITQATQQMSTIDATVAKLEQNAAGSADASAAMIDAVRTSTDANGDTPLSLQTRKLGELEAQNKNAEFYKQIGEDGVGQAKISSFLANAFQENTRAAVQQATDIQDRESVGLLDDPMAYIWNQLILPDAKNQLETTLKKGEVISKSMNELNQALNAHAANEKTYAATLSAASVESQVEGLKSNIEVKAQQARQAAYNYDSQNALTVMQAKGQRSVLISQIMSARSGEEHLKLAQEAAGRERTKFKQWQEDQKDTEDYINNITTLANKQAITMGKPLFERKQVALAMKDRAHPVLTARIQQFAEAGYINANSDALGNRFGETPSAALTFAVSTNTPVPPAISEIYTAAGEAANLEAKTKGLDTKNKALMDNLLNSKVKDLIAARSRNIDPRDASNPYVVPDLKVLAAAEEVKETALYQRVLAPQIAAGGLTNSDPKVLFAKGLEAVDSGKMTMGELAQDIVKIYSKGVQLNNIEKQFNRFGMPDQTGYQIKNLGPNIVFGTKPATPPDLTKLDDVNRIIIRMRAADIINTNPLGM